MTPGVNLFWALLLCMAAATSSKYDFGCEASHSDLKDQNLFHSTIDTSPGVPWVSKNPEGQIDVYSGQLTFSQN